jgi:dsDNA-specific endonuclease/ATPase MutS2
MFFVVFAFAAEQAARRRSACIAQAQQRCSSGKATSAVMSKNLKTVRRELRAACEERWKLRDEVHNLKQELPPSRSAWGQ